MTAGLSPRDDAIFQLEGKHDVKRKLATSYVDTTFATLEEPDRDMLDAGAGELARALPAGTGKAYLRDLAGVIWGAMLSRARL